MNQAIAAGIRDEMRADPTVVVWGEDVAEAGGVFKATVGLHEEFGDRVRDTPISEMGFLGAAVGAASTGLRPVVEIMFIEFLGVALDQLVTEAAFYRYLSAGEVTVPLVVRGSVGAGMGFGAQHSQTLERWLVGSPGIKVAMPSSSRTAYGLIRSAIRDDDPVVVLEPRALYAEREDLEPSDEHIIPLGQAELLTEGDDVTLITLGNTVGTALTAARNAAWSADVIDLLTLQPWDRQLVFDSVSKTGRLVVVEESPWSGGWGADIVAAVTEELFGELRAPTVRVTTPDVPVPFAAELEARYLPASDEVTRQVDGLLETGRSIGPWWLREESLR
ncbi:MAG TPA: transketolase C-terminal domain-containing protein [Acidimicrobiia bacterium]|nr:transketolase C-terminal domain-containing protein [Acidimicrobiia bacterium]